MLALGTALVAIVLSILIARIATVALTVTGLSREAARFQARSALTGTGFTTSEAEPVVDHPVRRRIIMVLMLVGSAGVVTLVAAVTLGFVAARGGADVALRIGLLLGGLLAVLALARNERVDRRLTWLIARLLRTYTDLDTRDYARLLKLSGEYAVTELTVSPGDWIAERTLAELGLTDEGVIVLSIQREDGSYIGVPRGDTPVLSGDVVILYGRGSNLAELDRRPAGPVGDEAHADAVARQRLVLNVEAYGDPAREEEAV